MDAYSIYIPMDRRIALTHGFQISDRVQGAALFADISGFTPLTEALVAELGPVRGVEEITRQLNQVYDSLVNELHRYGGSVISFGGDAVTCWFDEDDGIRAITCGVAMQSVMEEFASVTVPRLKRNENKVTVQIGMKVAVAYGQARRFIVGDPKVQLMDVLAGATLERLVAAEQLAQKGEILLEPSAVESLSDRVRFSDFRVDPETGERFGVFRELLSAATALSESRVFKEPLPDDVVRPWLLPPVYQSLQNGQGEFLAELRPAFALFLKFTGLDYDNDEQAGRKLDSFVKWVQGKLSYYEGYLLQLIIGDKGSYLYAAFGAPIAHEDDAQRAVSAALELKNPPSELSFIQSVQIGIVQGRMRTGAYGGTKRRTYGVIGDGVNIAARLMQAAGPGEILIDQTVHQAIENIFQLEQLEDKHVKGKTKLVTVFKVLGRRQRRSYHLQVPEYALPMVGRGNELALLKEKMDQAIQGQGQVVGIVGEAGIGKSRLVSEVVRVANEMKLTGFGGECESYGTDSSYQVWQPVWQGIFGVDPYQTEPEQLNRLEIFLAAIDKDLVHRLPLLSTVLNLRIPDNRITKNLVEKLRKQSLEDLLVTCIKAYTSKQPLLIVLEDCQWLDALSHDLLEVIGRAIQEMPVLVLIDLRPPEIARLQNPKVTELPNFTEIRLKRFSDQEARVLINLKINQFGEGISEFPEKLLLQIIQRTEGNPFYIEELINYFHNWKVDLGDSQAMGQFDLPDSLHSLILGRLDQLGEREQTTVKVASVIGRIFKAAYLSGMYPELGGPAEIRADLEKIQQAQIVVQEPSEPELAYYFRQVVMQEVSYGNLPFAMRRLLHKQFARYLENTYSQSLDQLTDLLAYHFYRGEEWQKATHFNLLVGNKAKHEFANDTAITAYRRSLESASYLDNDYQITHMKWEVNEALGDVLIHIGRYDEALDHFSEAQKLLWEETVSPKKTRNSANLSRKMAEVYERKGEYENAFTYLDKGLFGLSSSRPTTESARIFLLGAGVYQRLGKTNEALQWSQKCLDATSQIESEEARQVRAQVLYLRGLIQVSRGELILAENDCQESIQLYQQIEDIVGEAKAYNNLAIAYKEQGKWVQATEAYSKSLDINQKIGNIQESGFVTNNLAEVHRVRGEWDQALALFTQSNQIWKQLGAPLPDGVTLSNMAQVHLYLENWDTAREMLIQSQELFEKVGAEGFLPELERRWGEYYLRTGALDKALTHCNQSLELGLEQEARLEVGLTYRLLGEVHQAQGEMETAETAYQQSREILLELNSEYEAAKTTIQLARLAQINGSENFPNIEFTQAIQTFERLGAQVDLKNALLIKNSS